MDNLSLRQLIREAPGAAPVRGADQLGLLSTAAVIRHVGEKYKMKPVLAMQGRGHIDASHDTPESMGRHFVVCANKNGEAFFLLNSHQKHRRAHVGLGFWLPGDESFLIGPSFPIQRWKPFKETIKTLMECRRENAERIVALNNFVPEQADRDAFAKTMAKKGYTPFVDARPSPAALMVGLGVADATHIACWAIKRMVEGNLEAPVKSRRNIKGIKRPDGLFYAGLVAFYEIVELARLRRIPPVPPALPELRGRLPRA
jgi:hypothetical protein